MELPPFKRIFADLRARIESGELRPGDRVPSARALVRDYGVAIATATKAHAALREAGLTVSRAGVGTVVAGPAPRRDHELTLARMVEAAVSLADREGLAEVSMRRLAGELGVATMSLYRHVPGREDLLHAMIERTIGELRLPRRPPAWRAALELCARAEWAVFKRHPWLAPSMPMTRPQLAPSAMRLSEWVMTAFDGTAMPLAERMSVQILLFNYVRGIAGALEFEAEAVRDSGLTAEEWMRTQGATFAHIMDTTDMPHFRELATADFALDLDRLFDFGLARFLDGIEPLVAARGPAV